MRQLCPFSLGRAGERKSASIRRFHGSFSFLKHAEDASTRGNAKIVNFTIVGIVCLFLAVICIFIFLKFVFFWSDDDVADTDFLDFSKQYYFL